MTHGEAVAVGMIKAARISANIGIADKALVTRLEADFRACHLPTELPCPEDALEKALWKDKRPRTGKYISS